MAFFGRMLRAYDRALTNTPLLTKALSCVTVFTLTDMTSQALIKKCERECDCAADSTTEEKKKNPLYFLAGVDVVHSAKFGVLYGGLWAAPLFHTFFNVVKFMPVWGRIAAQTVVVDTANISMCMFLQTWLKGPEVDSVGKAVEFVKEEFKGAYRMGLNVLPLSHIMCNFVIPLPYRALYVSGQSFCWNTYLCCSICPTDADIVEVEETEAQVILDL